MGAMHRHCGNDLLPESLSPGAWRVYLGTQRMPLPAAGGKSGLPMVGRRAASPSAERRDSIRRERTAREGAEQQPRPAEQQPAGADWIGRAW